MKPLKVGEGSSFSLSDAIYFSRKSLIKRFTRSIITFLSIALAIAFLTVMEVAAAIQASVESYGWWLAIIAILVCGVGITNSMFMSVNSRYKEIGTLKCLGAQDKHILIIFILESLILGFLGGIAGTFLGYIAAIIIYSVDKVLSIGAIATVMYSFYSLLLAVIISVVAAIAPAYKAAVLTPVEALRHEI
ncbi:hypothetical protein DRO02_03460 [archaeon]|nr:MAG: hypothetical protein DRO21_05080 [archaeon]RLG64779.1 MAG: hypothetical protein DRO02_03460 [archaeon]